MSIIAILTGIAALINYYAITSAIYPLLLGILFQVVLFVLTLIVIFKYRGKRTRPSYDRAGYKVWTFSFSLIVLSFIGNLAILAVLFLNQLNYISSF